MYKLHVFCVFLYFISSVYSKKFCNTSKECIIEGATCQQGLCVCDPGKIINSDESKCIEISPGYGTKCTEDAQCMAWVLGSSICHPTESLCTCSRGYRYFNNKCIPAVDFNENCDKNEDCYDGIDMFALKCDKRKCVCNDGYYLRANSDCRVSAKTTGECFFDIDCESPEKYCDFNYGPYGTCVDNKIKSTSSQITEKFPSTEITEKYTYAGNLDKVCASDEDCNDLKNSICPEFRKKCTCKESFIYDKNSKACVRMLGSKCTEDNDCDVKHSYCNADEKCQCNKYFIYGKYGDKCFKPTHGYNMSCGRNENCYSLGIYGVCNNNKCECKTNSEYNEAQNYCVPLNDPGENSCEKCEDILNAECVNNKCECKENYEKIGQKCAPNIGFDCNPNKDDCVIENAECSESNNSKESTCLCKEGYIKNDARECVEELSSPEDHCISDLQCQTLLGTGSNCYNGNCTCLPDFVSKIINDETKCIKIRAYGDSCSNLIHCTTMKNYQHVVCRNNKCLCEYEYKMVEEDKEIKCVLDNGSAYINSYSLLSTLIIVSILNTFK